MSAASSSYFIGLISGTSVDGIDAGLFEFRGLNIRLAASHCHRFPDAIKRDILRLTQPGSNEIDIMGELDVKIGLEFAQSANYLIHQAGLSKRDISGIGSHGQTIRHRPKAPFPFTLQIGDPNTIAQHCGITTVADLRRRDISAGGQGAPLAPAFHQAVFFDAKERRCIANIGGIANVSVLNNDPNRTVGYDTGPGNVLMDAWIHKHRGAYYDEHGSWASTGTINNALLQRLLSHEYFAKKHPKSSGREEFHLSWLESVLSHQPSLNTEDVQATLCELTAKSLANSVRQHSVSHLYLCGGGAHNKHLISRISASLPDINVTTSETLGIPPNWVEAGLVAWLAKRALTHQPGNIPNVTGARSPVILGAVYPS